MIVHVLYYFYLETSLNQSEMQQYKLNETESKPNMALKSIAVYTSQMFYMSVVLYVNIMLELALNVSL